MRGWLLIGALAGGVRAGITAPKDVVVDMDSGLHAPVALGLDDDLALAYLSRRAVVHAITSTHGSSLARWTCQSAKAMAYALAFWACLEMRLTYAESDELEFARSNVLDVPTGKEEPLDLSADVKQQRDSILRAQQVLSAAPKVFCGGGFLGAPYVHAPAHLQRNNPMYTVLALGPLTNIAAALAGAAGSKPFGRLVFAGGHFEPDGTSLFEFNVAADGRAMETVLASSVEKVVLPVNLLRDVVLARQDVVANGDWLRKHAAALQSHARMASMFTAGGGGAQSVRAWAAAAAVFYVKPELFGAVRCHPARVVRRMGVLPVLEANWTSGVPGKCHDARNHIAVPHSMLADDVKQELLAGLKAVQLRKPK